MLDVRLLFTVLGILVAMRCWHLASLLIAMAGSDLHREPEGSGGRHDLDCALQRVQWLQ